MDLKIYYQKIRNQRSTIRDEFPIVVSNETPDGGKSGALTEVPRDLAAKLLVDGAARLANEVEAREFRQAQADMRKAVEDERAVSRVQVTLVPRELLESLRKKG